MSQMTTGDLLQEFQTELDKSAVISEEFKKWLQGKMVEMASVAYKHGYKEGVKEEKKIKKSKPNTRADRQRG